ncbi:helix-turn-helix domain-containing protein [Massilia sp. IC2-477]|uniref:helix-turn-helix domain-containing protein n=1 Tax=Massilia sp. IC2-477 TaxID=2887198 RepID=UPI001D1118DC|nr:helix-turn-helix domain-containing protein [Massilia sp. IC2-477]MCC2955827.1 helix-turn-helix domain-containing protein [Massilia sp. IC2-477]
MAPDSHDHLHPCPDPLARSPRACSEGKAPLDRLYLAPAALQDAMLALISRDTSHVALSDAQRLSHFPASPIVTLSWFHGLDAGLVDARGWHPFGARVMISGSQSHSLVAWAPTGGRGYMACFLPDAAQALFGLDLATVQDRFLPAHAVLGEAWRPLFDALLAAADDATALRVLEAQLGKRWRTVQGRSAERPSLRQIGRHWVQQLAWKAYEWRSTHSERQVERRIKAFSGRSLREWQSLVRTEGMFFAARERYENGQPFDWATLALDEGFSDQAHMSRVTRQICGFPPTEFANRYIEDESFWIYRLWV